MIIGDILRHSFCRYPKKIAAVFKDRRISYEQLYERTNRLANGLLKIGLKQGDRIAILSRNCSEYLEFYFATAKAGLIAVPLNYRLTVPEIISMINDSEAKALVIHQEFMEVIKKVLNEIRTAKHFVGIGGYKGLLFEGEYSFEDLINESSPNEPNVMIKEDDIWLIQFTSGTTGQPKGFLTTHKNSILGIISYTIELRVAPEDRCLLCVPFCFAASGSTRFYGIARGCTNIIINFEPGLFLETVANERITITTIGPAAIKEVLNHSEIGKYDLRSMKTLGITTGPATPEMWKNVDKFFGRAGIPCYGLTETCLLGCILQRAELDEDPGRLTSIGKAAFGAEVRVVNEDGKDVLKNLEEVGEIWVKGMDVKGYLNLPEESKNLIKDGFVRTGDLAVVSEDGYIHIVGRVSDMIRSGGLKISPVEIERVISTHPAVLQVAVIGVPSEKWGETPCALIKLKDGEKATKEEIIEFCARYLASFKKPTSIEFVDNFPITVSGKIKKEDLRKKYWKGFGRTIG